MALPVISEDISQKEIDDMLNNAMTASNFLKAISHEGRLMILCYLASGEKSVTDLEKLLSWWRSLGEVREVEIFIESNPMRQKITLLSTVVPSIPACN